MATNNSKVQIATGTCAEIVAPPLADVLREDTRASDPGLTVTELAEQWGFTVQHVRELLKKRINPDTYTKGVRRWQDETGRRRTAAVYDFKKGEA